MPRRFAPCFYPRSPRKRRLARGSRRPTPVTEDRPAPEPEVPEIIEPEVIVVPSGVSVLEMARALHQPVGELVRQLLSMGLMAAAAAPVPPRRSSRWLIISGSSWRSSSARNPKR